jgi:GTP diphosphokinase / guanosine-3',5'-bis(diphosphate) 3'-diphosphatase
MIKEFDQPLIDEKFAGLKALCKDFTKSDLAILEKAYQFALKVYDRRQHASGEMKIAQSIEVAKIVSGEIGLRITSVIAALLHDIIDAPDENLSEVVKQFGSDVATIVKGFKKISAIRSDKAGLQSENFRSLYLHSVEDIRVIFIKIAHRLYDMRIYPSLPDHHKKWFLDDVQLIYIPIAHRLGLYQIKAELEDFTFKYLNPAEYNRIVAKINESKEEQNRYIQKFIQPIIKVLASEKIICDIKSRTKTISSIKKKMDKQGVDIDQVYDLFAIRVILTGTLTDEEFQFLENFEQSPGYTLTTRHAKRSKKEKSSEITLTNFDGETDEELEIGNKIKEKERVLIDHQRKRYTELLNSEKTACWKVYSLITNIYTPNPKRLRDWISAPKPSGYESLHTTVLGPDDRYVEVQIRTKRMDDHAEKGSAAHWRYKESAYGKDIASWMEDVRNLIDNMRTQHLDLGTSAKVLNDSGKIYVFTPEGDLRELRKGATVLDFAFDIHSNVGCGCIGGKINGKVMPIRHELQNGDKVEIIISKKQKPNSDWLNFVVTSKAKSRINRALREQKYSEAENGKETLQRKFKNWKIELNDQAYNRILKRYGFRKPVDLHFNIATGKINVLEIKEIFTGMEEIDEKADKSIIPSDLTEQLIETQSEKDQGYILIEAGVSNLNYSLAKCCNPIAGDNIFGFVTVNSGIKIHRYDCPNAGQLREKYPYRIIKAKWKESSKMQFFVSNLRIVGNDRIGLVSDVTKLISNDLKVNIKDLSFSTNGGAFEGKVKVQVRDVDHLGFLKQKLLKIKGITRVVRFD